MINNDQDLLLAAKEAAQDIFRDMEKLEHLQTAHNCLDEGELCVQMPNGSMIAIDDITDIQYEDLRTYIHNLFNDNMVEVRQRLLKASGKGIMANPEFEKEVPKPEKKAGRPKKN